jgi:molybdenum cofactor cytidylyltransferase
VEDRDIYLTVSDKNLKALLNIIKIKNRDYSIIRKVSLAAVIMASGSSRRYGKENKLLQKIGGKTFFTRVLETIVRSDTFSAIIVVTRYDEIIIEAEKYWNITCIYNKNADEGISESVKKGVEAADREGSDGYMFIPCDQVFLSEKTIRKLSVEFVEKSDSIVSPLFNGEFVSPVIFPKRFKERLLKLTGDKGGRGIISENRGSITGIEINDEKEIRDIDTPEDYKKWGALKNIVFRIYYN